MSMNQQDWRRLRLPILGLGLALVVVGLLVNYAQQYRSKNDGALKTQQQTLLQAKQKFESSGQEKQAIAQYLPIYNNLLAKGFIGEERRIEWIESLRQIHNQHKLFSIEYTIGLQENYKPNFLPSLGNFVLHKSTMKVNLDMLHEGDLVNLLDGLKKQPTPFIVRDCEIKRPVGINVNSKIFSANMRAACEIDWLTLRDPLLKAGL
jgi:hypothetical protein